MKKLLLLLLAVLLVCFSINAFAEENKDEYPKENLIGEITYAEMEDILNKGQGEDRIYIKQSDDKVLVFQGLGLDDSICKQVIIAIPEEKLLQVYSNDKKACNKLYKVARNFSKNMLTMNGHNVVADKSQTVKIDDKVQVHKFWLKKFRVEGNPQSVRVHRRGINLPIGIGIGIGRHGHGHIGIGL